MHKFARIAYNSADWHHPTGKAGLNESAETYNATNGFGHEEWLFRSDWLIDGWRYAFIQGVNKSRDKLLRDRQPIDLTLFTIDPGKRRRFVATIYSVECLDDRQSKEAVAEFKKRGWFETMRTEIKTIGGKVDAFGSGDYAPHIVNVRFRSENVRPSPPNSYAAMDSPIYALTRYQLYDLREDETNDILRSLRAGLPDLPDPQPFHRPGTVAVDCTPEHARMQKQLMLQLQAEFPSAELLRENDFIDLSVKTSEELLLFEIKSDLEPRSVIRHALGQILEYDFHPRSHHSLPLRLFIVGRNELMPQDAQYLAHLKQEFSLPIDYRVVSI